MPNELTARERTILLALLAYPATRDLSNNDLDNAFGLRLKATERHRLESAGYITAVKGKGNGPPYLHTLTELGSKRAESEFDASSSPPQYCNPRVAYSLFAQMHEFVRKNYLDFTAVFGMEQSHVQSDIDEMLATAITEKYQQLSTSPASWVSLRYLRHELSDVPREELDETLALLFASHRIRLTEEVNRKALTKNERGAAVIIAGNDKHLISIG